MSHAEHPEIREFTQKMRNEGSAGFADGPWEETELANDTELTASQRRKKNWGMNSSRRTRQRTLGDRVLTWVTILTLITLVAGVGGTWLSYQPEPEVTVLATDRLNKTPSLERVESRLTRMERRLSHILDPYIRMLNNLSGELDDTQKQLIEHIQDAGQQQAATTGIEERLENVEQRLASADERMDTLSTMLATLPAGTAETLPGKSRDIPATPVTEDTPAEVSPTEPVTATREVADDSPLLAMSHPAEQQDETAIVVPEPVPVTAPAASAPAPETVAATQQQAAEPTAEPVVPPAPVSEPGTAKGNWVINIASYTNERIARRKLAQMQQQGFDVELVTAELNGKTIYRARVFGFASRRDATSAATEIKSRLGLEETWITKR